MTGGDIRARQRTYAMRRRPLTLKDVSDAMASALTLIHPDPTLSAVMAQVGCFVRSLCRQRQPTGTIYEEHA